MSATGSGARLELPARSRHRSMTASSPTALQTKRRQHQQLDLIYAANTADSAVLGFSSQILVCPGRVLIDQGPSLEAIDLKPLGHNSFLVVLALDRCFACEIVLAFQLGWIEPDVVRPP